MGEAQRGAAIWSTVVTLSAIAMVAFATLAIDNRDWQMFWGFLGAGSVCAIAHRFGMYPHLEKMVEEQGDAQ